MATVLIWIGYALVYGSWFYSLILLARVALDWARILVPRWTPKGPLLTLFDLIYRVTDPPVRFLRRFIPPIRLGNIALDVGFMLLFIGVLLLGRIGQWLVFLGLTHA